ncbi:hypothetical protein GVAV_002646 [Gurleya vavrai]
MKTLEQVFLYSCLIDTSDIHFLESLKSKNVKFHILRKSLNKSNFKNFTSDLKKNNISISKTRQQGIENSIRNFVNSVFCLLENSIERIIIKKADCVDKSNFKFLNQNKDSHQQTKEYKVNNDKGNISIPYPTIECLENCIKNLKTLCLCLVFKVNKNGKIHDFSNIFDLRKYYNFEDNSLFQEYTYYLIRKQL